MGMGARRRAASAFRPLPTACCLLLSAFWLLPGAGCRSNCDLVEAELRSRDHELREVRDELHRMQMYNDGLQREMRALKRHHAAGAPPEESTLVFTLKSVTLGRQTGGYDDDDCPGDEALQVVLEPRDVDNHVVKVPGTLDVRVMEVSPEGLKKPLAWHLAPDQLRQTWRSGLLSTGYFVVLPWKVWPAAEKLRVVVLFSLADGRAFEADKDVNVRLPPLSRRKPLPAVPDELETAPVEQAPAPRRIDPPPASADKMPGAQPAGLWQNSASRSLSGAVQILPPRPRR
jgi:hypothetical protein